MPNGLDRNTALNPNASFFAADNIPLNATLTALPVTAAALLSPLKAAFAALVEILAVHFKAFPIPLPVVTAAVLIPFKAFFAPLINILAVQRKALSSLVALANVAKPCKSFLTLLIPFIVTCKARILANAAENPLITPICSAIILTKPITPLAIVPISLLISFNPCLPSLELKNLAISTDASLIAGNKAVPSSILAASLASLN